MFGTSKVGITNQQVSDITANNAKLSANSTNVSNAGALMKVGNATIDDVKTFTSSPIVPTPTTDTQASNKKYSDDKTTIKETRANNTRKFWDGTQAQKDAVITKDPNTYYLTFES